VSLPPPTFSIRVLPKARMVNGERQIAVLFACFHFDECQSLAAPRDQIHFAARGFDTLANDAPALQPQPPRCDILAAPPAFFGIFAAAVQMRISQRTVSPEPVEPKATEGERRPKGWRWLLGRASTGSALTVK